MKRLFLLNLLFVIKTLAFSQQMRLPDAVSIALKNSLDIQVVRNNLNINEVSNSYGFAGGLPLVTASGSDNEQSVNIKQKISQKINGVDTSYNIIRNGATSNQLTGGASGSIVLFNGLRIVSTKRALEEMEKQGQEYVNSQIQNVIASVMTSYYDIVRQQGYIKTIKQSIAVSSQKL